MFGAFDSLPDFVLPVSGYFLVANGLALLLFKLGKAQSPDGEWGGAETRTLFLSMMGGWLGAVIGHLLFQRTDAKGFGLSLKLSVLVLPAIIAVPLLVGAAPRMVAAGTGQVLLQGAPGGAAQEPAVSSDAD